MIQMRLDQAVARRVDASDVVQDVLLEASQRLAEYIQNPSMPFHLWLRQLAKDRVIDMHRRHRGAQRRSVDREHVLSHLASDERSAADLASLLKDQELTPPLLPFAAKCSRDSWMPWHCWMNMTVKSS